MNYSKLRQMDAEDRARCPELYAGQPTIDDAVAGRAALPAPGAVRYIDCSPKGDWDNPLWEHEGRVTQDSFLVKAGTQKVLRLSRATLEKAIAMMNLMED